MKPVLGVLAALTIVGLCVPALRLCTVPFARLRAEGPAQQVFVLRTQGVLVDVAVTRGGLSVPGLGARDFTLLDEGVPQDITVVSSQDRAVSTVLALDASASTRGERLDDLLGASRAFVNDLSPGDSAALRTTPLPSLPRRRLRSTASGR